MDSVEAYLQSGDLEAARAGLVAWVRGAPDDQRARMALFQLMLVNGEWDKARNQVEVLARLSPEAQMLSVVYGQAIAAETARLAAFAGKGAFKALVADVPWLALLCQALDAFARGDRAAGETQRAQAFDMAGETPGRCNDAAFAWICDADARFGPSLEAIVGGTWGLLPFEALSEIKSSGPRDMRDLVWLPVELTLRSGQSAAAFLPARYPGSETAPDPRLRLGRLTQWGEGASGQEGLGQRLWSFDAAPDMGLLALRSLVLSRAAP